MNTSLLMETELGLERRCNKCGEWWPLDGEFFHRQPHGFQGWSGICIDCRTQGTSRRYLDERRIATLLDAGYRVASIALMVGCSESAVYQRKARSRVAA